MATYLNPKLKRRQCGNIIINNNNNNENIGLVLGDSCGVVNSLDFSRHRLSPLAAFTSGAYFLHNGRR